jgi:hypothetical protein
MVCFAFRCPSDAGSALSWVLQPFIDSRSTRSPPTRRAPVIGLKEMARFMAWPKPDRDWPNLFDLFS